MPSFGSNQWLAIGMGATSVALCYSLVLLGKLTGPEFVGYCQIAVPALTGLSLGGSAAVKILAKQPGAEG